MATLLNGAGLIVPLNDLPTRLGPGARAAGQPYFSGGRGAHTKRIQFMTTISKGQPRPTPRYRV